MDKLMVGVWLSNSCHRKCDHCYSAPMKSEGIMGVTQTQQTANWIADTVEGEKVRNLHIAILGGEPLNNVEAVFLLSDILKERIKSVHIGFEKSGVQFVLFTNGDLLTDQMLESMKRNKIVILLNPTYDSLEEIEKKILKIKQFTWCSLSIALNDFNLPRLEDLAKLAVKQDCHIRTNRLYNGGTILNYVDEYKFQMKKMFNVLLEAKSPMWPNIIMESTVPTYPGPKNPCLCGKRYIVIDVDGTIRSCNPDQDTKIGSIYTHNFKDLKFPQRWSAKNLPECQGCEWITWCQGGCPYTRKLAYGTYERKSPFCSAFKELFPMLMELKKKYENRIITRMVDSKEDLDQIKEMFGKGVR